MLTTLVIAVSNPLEHVLPHELLLLPHQHGTSPFTNQMIMATVAGLLMLWIFPKMFRDADPSAPTGAKNFFETILEFLRVEVIRPALKENTDRFLPFLWTLFFFILFCNLLGFIPIGEIISLLTWGRVEHLGGTATGTVSTTGALAILTFCFIHGSGIVQVYRSLRDGTYGHHDHHDEHSSNGAAGHEAAHDLPHMRGEGLAADIPNDFRAATDPTHHYKDGEHPSHTARVIDYHGAAHSGKDAGSAALLAIPLYLWNFAPHPFKPKPGASQMGWLADLPIWGLLLVLELVGALIKPFSLAIRLFANMIAGHIVLAVLAGLIVTMPSVAGQIKVGIPVTLLSLMIRMLELFVSFLQAYIFTFLATLFIASAVAPEH
jgi:F0F1-type ATP synthase membrane subunit a